MAWADVSVSDITWTMRDQEQPYVSDDFVENDYVNDPYWTVRAVVTATWNEQ